MKEILSRLVIFGALSACSVEPASDSEMGTAASKFQIEGPSFADVYFASKKALTLERDDRTFVGSHLAMSDLQCGPPEDDSVLCQFKLGLRKRNLTVEDHGLTDAIGPILECEIEMQRRQGDHDIYWVDSAADGSGWWHDDGPSTVKCSSPLRILKS